MTYPHDAETTYVDWEFGTIWVIAPERNDGYPLLDLWSHRCPVLMEDCSALTANAGETKRNLCTGDRIREARWCLQNDHCHVLQASSIYKE